MNSEERIKFWKLFKGGLLVIIVTYVILTIMRDIRDNFMSNMWNELGYGNKPSVFTKTETITSVVVLVIMSLLVIVRNNYRAFRLVHLVIGGGFVLAGISSALYIAGMMDGAIWMQLTGMGLYMGYIPFNCIFFERMIASFKVAGNVGFLMYLVDAWGYFGSMSVMLAKEILKLKMNWVSFYSTGVIGFSILGIVALFFSLKYFDNKHRKKIAWEQNLP